MSAPRAGGAGLGRTGRDVTRPGERAGRPLPGHVRARARTRASPRITSSSSSWARRTPRGRPAVARRHGWIYPTDSSINVAIGQGRRVQPRGLVARGAGCAGRWVVVAPDLGFPAGKNKTILIDLGRSRGPASPAQPAPAADEPRDLLGLRSAWPRRRRQPQLATTRLQAGARRAAATAASRHDRSLRAARAARDAASTTASPTRRQRWRDLVGYYTRFGDVRELARRRRRSYVIMNAGDELQLSFPAPPAPPRRLDAAISS